MANNNGWQGKLEGLDLQTYERVAKLSKHDIQAVLLVWNRLKTSHPSWYEFERLDTSTYIKLICKDIVKDNKQV